MPGENRACPVKNRPEGVTAIQKDREELLIGRILANAASQLRGPLGNLHAALGRIAPPQARDADPALDADAALVYQNYYRLLRVVGNLTAAAELYDDDCLLLLRNGDLVGLCREICSGAAYLARQQGQELTFTAREPYHIVAYHEGGMERVLLNLLSNAMKFTPAGGQVMVGLETAGGMVEITVSDTGCGIPQELLPTLFDRYRHVERMDPAPHGLGLGLPICHRIVSVHEGEIFITSSLGRGTRVTVRIPDRQLPVTQVNTMPFDYAGGFNHTLLELSDALGTGAFRQKEME